MWAVTAIGIGLNAGGLFYAWRAQRSVQRDLGLGEMPWDAAWRRAATLGRRLWYIGRRRDATVHAATGTASGALTVTGEGYGLVTEAIDSEASPHDQVLTLERNMRKFLQAEREARDRAVRKATEQMTQRLSQLEKARDQRAQEERALAASTVRDEMTGLLLVALGTLILAVDPVIRWVFGL